MFIHSFGECQVFMCARPLARYQNLVVKKNQYNYVVSALKEVNRN